MKLIITGAKDPVWRYHWRLIGPIGHDIDMLSSGYTVTIWGARWGAKRAKRKLEKTSSWVGKVFVEEEL